MQQKLVRGPIQLTDIHSSGRCIGHLGDKQIYIIGGIPGEEITFTLNRTKQGYRSGQIETVVTPSPYRVTPFCKHYETCGGCPWQHIDYPHQLELKHRILLKAFEKYGLDYPEMPAVIPSPEIRYYRHRMEYSFTEKSFRKSSGNLANMGVLGFHPYGASDKVIAIDECFLQAEPSRTICRYIEQSATDKGLSFYNPKSRKGLLRSLSIRLNREGKVLLVIGLAEERNPLYESWLSDIRNRFPEILSLNDTIHPSASHAQIQGDIRPVGDDEPYMHEKLDDCTFRIHATSFFQPNILQAERIFSKAVAWAELTEKETVIELYAGVGTLALYMAPRAGHVTGIEGSDMAVADARENARLQGLQNVQFLTGDILKTFTLSFLESYPQPDLIILDPPRSGTLIEIKKTILASAAQKVLYLSCNPVSLAFDLKQLSSGYRISRVQPFDMLPHTQHLETLVLLERR